MSSIADEMDRLRIQLREYRKDMASISPRTSLYASLAAKCTEIETTLASRGAARVILGSCHSQSVKPAIPTRS